VFIVGRAIAGIGAGGIFSGAFVIGAYLRAYFSYDPLKPLNIQQFLYLACIPLQLSRNDRIIDNENSAEDPSCSDWQVRCGYRICGWATLGRCFHRPCILAVVKSVIILFTFDRELIACFPSVFLLGAFSFAVILFVLKIPRQSDDIKVVPSGLAFKSLT
jgi:hypothetical protein